MVRTVAAVRTGRSCSFQLAGQRAIDAASYLVVKYVSLSFFLLRCLGERPAERDVGCAWPGKDGKGQQAVAAYGCKPYKTPKPMSIAECMAILMFNMV